MKKKYYAIQRYSNAYERWVDVVFFDSKKKVDDFIGDRTHFEVTECTYEDYRYNRNRAAQWQTLNLI